MAKELTPFQRTIAIITVISLLVYSIINLSLVITAYTSLDGNVNQLSEAISNWQTGSIQEIAVATTCPAGYESVTNNRVWPGVKQGCWCGNITKATLDSKNITCGPFCDGACSTDARSVGCTGVSPIAQQPLNYLGKISSTNTYNQICVKRSLENWASAASLVNIVDGTCPSGYKKCGSSKENVFCTKESKCPITSITISTILSTQVSACTSTPTTCAIVSNDGTDIRKITWSRGDVQDSLPLSEFKLDEYGICKLKSQDNVTPGRPLFGLLNNKPSSCNNDGGNKWGIADSVKEDKLFAANGLTTSITSLNSFPNTGAGMTGYYASGMTGANYVWNLFNRGYIPWALSCRDRMEALIDKKTLVDDMKSSQLALMIIGVISSFFLGIPLAIMEVMNLRGTDLPCFDGKGEEERTKLKKFRKTATYIFKGLQLPFQMWAIIVAGSSKTLFIDLSDEQCSNADTNAVMVYLSGAITKTYSSTISALGMLAATLIFDLILEAWEKRKTKNDQAKAVVPIKGEKLEVSNLDNSMGPLNVSQPQIQPQQQTNTPAPNIVIQIQPSQIQPSTGYPQQQQYPPQQYPSQQYPPQQYSQPGYAQQYPPQQYPAQQYPQQQYPQQYSGYTQQPPPQQFGYGQPQ